MQHLQNVLVMVTLKACSFKCVICQIFAPNLGENRKIRCSPCVPFSFCGKVNAHPPLCSQNTGEKLPQKQALLRPLLMPQDTKEITCNRFPSIYFVQMFLIVFSLYATIMLSSGKPITFYDKIFVSSEARRYAASCIPLCSKSPEAAE